MKWGYIMRQTYIGNIFELVLILQIPWRKGERRITSVSPETETLFQGPRKESWRTSDGM
jgi:hypothetical protein